MHKSTERGGGNDAGMLRDDECVPTAPWDCWQLLPLTLCNGALSLSPPGPSPLQQLLYLRSSELLISDENDEEASLNGSLGARTITDILL